jgi:6-phosphogluconolactonase
VFGFHHGSDGVLKAMGVPNFTVGSLPSAMAFHPPGDFMYIANFGGNNITLLDINKSNGELSVPVSTSIVVPLAPPNIFPAGSGPIAMVASPTGPFLYVANQGSGNISEFTIDPGTGDLGAIKGVTLVTIAPGAHPTSIAISPKGNFLFTADPILGSVGVFAIGADGGLTAAAPPVTVGGAGATPTFVATEASGRFIYVADPAHNVVLGFAVQSGGTLTPIAGSPFAAGAAPSALAVDPQGALLYAANTTSNNVSAYVIDATTGALGPVTGSPFSTGGSGPSFLTVDANTGFLYVGEKVTNDVAVFAIASNGALAPVQGSPFNVATPPAWIVSLKR